jgi:hypothetical protein
MQLRLLANVVIGLACAATVEAAPPIDLELATEQGVQITAPQEWLQLLAGIGIQQVRIRGIQAGDEPRVESRGTPQRPSYHVVGIIAARDQLHLPGGVFSRGDRAKLKDYFDRLSADGPESLTAPRGRFGLTEKDLATVFADLSQSIDFETKGQQPRAVLNRLQTKLALKFAVDAEAERTLRAAAPMGDELKGLTAGTGLAMMLRNYGLVLQPEKSRGQPIVYRVAVPDGDAIRQSTLGRTGESDSKYWPIGWEPEKAPGATAPSLMESLNAEIDGYTLEEALAAIGPRLKLPMYLDHATLDAHNIEPGKVQIKLARARMSYKRLLDRVLAQAHLGSSLRVDESGRPFLWVTR